MVLLNEDLARTLAGKLKDFEPPRTPGGTRAPARLADSPPPKDRGVGRRLLTFPDISRHRRRRWLRSVLWNRP
jgi:hypothetical protein